MKLFCCVGLKSNVLWYVQEMSQALGSHFPTSKAWTPKDKLAFFWSLFVIILPVLLGWDSRNEEETEKCDTSGGSAERGDQRKRRSPCESTSRLSANREGEGIIKSKNLYTYTFLQRMISMISQTASCSWAVVLVLLDFPKLFCNWTIISQYPLEVLVTQIFCVSDKFNLCL